MKPSQFEAAMNDIHERVNGQRFSIRVRTKRTKDGEWFEGFPSSDNIYQTGVITIEAPPSGLWYIELCHVDLIELGRVFPSDEARSIPKWNYSRLLAPSQSSWQSDSEELPEGTSLKVTLVGFLKNLSIRAKGRTGS
jgi:hypothetical protein